LKSDLITAKAALSTVTKITLTPLVITLLASAAILDAAVPARTNYLAQSVATSPLPSVLLKVTETDISTVTPIGENKFLYLRVFSDRTAESESSFQVRKGESNVRITYKKTLTQEECKRLRTLIDKPELAKIKTKYDGFTIDFSVEWQIRLAHLGEIREIDVFQPSFESADKDVYPLVLAELGCAVQKLRFDMSGESSDFVDGNCKKLLRAM
jgi:hypothetical protein